MKELKELLINYYKGSAIGAGIAFAAGPIVCVVTLIIHKITDR